MVVVVEANLRNKLNPVGAAETTTRSVRLVGDGMKKSMPGVA
jgi:hypothetical protein